VSQWGTTFRPPQVPQQPPVFFTPTQSPAPFVSGTWQQQAAYFRQRIEIPQPPVFQPPAIPAPYIAPQRVQPLAPPMRPMLIEIEETLPFFTPTAAPGVVPPRAPDQTQATWRPLRSMVIEIEQAMVNFTATTPVQVPGAALQMPFPPRREMTAEQFPLAARQATTSPVGVVPPVPIDQTAATWRPLRSMLVEIEEAMPLFTAPAPAVFVPAVPLQIPFAARWDSAALLQSISVQYTVPAPTPPPPQPAVQMPFAPSRQEFAPLAAAVTRFVTPMSAPAPYVPPPFDQQTQIVAYRREPQRNWQLPQFTVPAPAFLIGGPRYIVARVRARVFTIARAFARQFTVSTVARRFEVLGLDEQYPLTFDATIDLLSGETLVGTPTLESITVSPGSPATDPTPATIQNGALALDPTSMKVIMPAKGNGIDGVDYDIVVKCATSNPLKTLTWLATLPVRVKNT